MRSAPERKQEACLQEHFELVPLGLEVTRRQAKKLRLDAAIVNHFSWAAFWLATTHTPFLFLPHDGFIARPWLLRRPLDWRIGFNFVARRATRVIALSKEEEQALTKYVRRERLILLPNELRLGDYETPAEQRQDPTDIIYVGHYSAEKGVLVILEAASLLKRWLGIQLKVRFVGFHTARQASMVETVAQTLGLAREQIDMQQGMPLELLIRHLQSARVLVSPSYAEAQNTVIEEALLLGTPVIATRVGAAEELLPRQSRFSPGNSLELAEVLEQFLRSPWKPQLPRETGHWCDRLRHLLQAALEEKDPDGRARES
jgi:glycosyltransferase involved in cell wall biosynthesis